MLLDSGKGDYTPEQLETVRGIVRAFKAVQPAIGIVGHSEISLTGKTDPGPTFPIEEIRGL
jgi:N-acetyl-anhydromuramyl-L-alanine amidase AmpD